MNKPYECPYCGTNDDDKHLPGCHEERPADVARRLADPPYPDSLPTPLKVTRFAIDFDEYWQDFAYLLGPADSELARAYEAKLKERLDPEHHGEILKTEIEIHGAVPSVGLMEDVLHDNECQEWLLPSIEQLFEDGLGEDAIEAARKLHELDARFAPLKEPDLRALGDVEGTAVIRWLNLNEPPTGGWSPELVEAVLEDAPRAMVRSRTPIPVAPGQQELELGKEGKVQ